MEYGLWSCKAKQEGAGKKKKTLSKDSGKKRAENLLSSPLILSVESVKSTSSRISILIPYLFQKVVKS